MCDAITIAMVASGRSFKTHCFTWCLGMVTTFVRLSDNISSIPYFMFFTYYSWQ